MSTVYEPFVIVKKLPAKIDLPVSWRDLGGSEVEITVDSSTSKIHIRFSEHDDELDFLREFNSFLGNLKKKTKVIAIDFGGLEEDFEITKLFELEGHILISLDEAKKRLRHIPIDNKGRLKNIGEEKEINNPTTASGVVCNSLGCWFFTGKSYRPRGAGYGPGEEIKNRTYSELRRLCDTIGAVHYQTTAYKIGHKLRSCLYIG